MSELLFKCTKNYKCMLGTTQANNYPQETKTSVQLLHLIISGIPIEDIRKFKQQKDSS